MAVDVTRTPRPAHASLPWRLEFALLTLVVLAGGALRFYQLGFQSLWLDEAASVAFASGDLGYIFRFTFSKEPNPPLYYVLLHYWLLFFGTAEAAVRSLSAAAGTASLVALYAVGRQLFNPVTGLLAAAVMAVSPFHFWLSQETRAFALLSLFSLLTLYALLRALASEVRGWWLAYSVLALATIYLHLFGFLVLGAFVLMAPLVRRPERAWLLKLALATAVPVLLYLPWLFSLLNQFGEPQWRTRLGVTEILRQTARTLPMGEELVWEYAGRGWVVWLALAALPVPLLAVRPRPVARLLALGVWQAAPLVASYLISFVSPIYAPRYLIVIAPAFYLAIAVGLARLTERIWPVAPLALALLALTAAPVFAAAYSVPLKEDYRGAARYLREHTVPGDAIVIMAGYLEYAFLYYGVDGETPLGDVTGSAQVPPALAPLADRHPRLWFVQSHYEIVDPGRHAERWLLERCSVKQEKHFTGIRIRELECTTLAADSVRRASSLATYGARSILASRAGGGGAT